jgi:hypothetical protein
MTPDGATCVRAALFFITSRSGSNMRKRLFAPLMALALFAAACTDRVPTDTQSTASPSFKADKKDKDRAGVLTNIPVTQGAFSGTLSITHIGIDPATRQLLFSGTVTRTSDGLSDTFTDVPATLSRTSGAGLAAGGGITAQAVGGPAEPGVCDILFLDIPPISLDLLGLQLDLSEIILDLDAAPGPGNLLGNLLCAVTGLLDGGGLLSALTGLLDRINAILDAI